MKGHLDIQVQWVRWAQWVQEGHQDFQGILVSGDHWDCQDFQEQMACVDLLGQ